jgi:Tol biopolymer transport system component
MVTADGRVKVLDFGLAKLLEPPDSSPDGTTLTMGTMTEEGAVMGTVAYMSPEQAEGRRLDARSDIFSFGSMLYEMVTARLPFRGDSRLSTLTKIVSEDAAPPSRIGVPIPTELERIILRCLRKDPGRRYQTMADLKVALEDVQEESGPHRPSRIRSPRPWIPMALLLAGGGFFGWRYLTDRESPVPLRAAALTTLPGPELYPTMSPDGEHVAFTWKDPKQNTTDIYVQLIGSGSPLHLTSGGRSDYNPVWSPDGRQIAFLRGDPARPLATSHRELRLIPPLGGPERKLADIHVHDITLNPVYLAWCPDSTCLVVSDSTGHARPDALFIVSAETGEKVQLTHPKAPVLADTSPAVSPDGRSLVFLRSSTWGAGELHWAPLGKGFTVVGEPRRLTAGRLAADYPTWLPNSEAIVFSARGTLYRKNVSASGEPSRLPFVGEDGWMPVLSRSRAAKLPRLVYVRSFADKNIWRLETSGPGTPSSSPPSVVISSTRADIHPAFSPDGRRVAFAGTRSGDWEIWVSDPDGSNAVQLTHLGAQATGVPKWSPDGQWITFASDAEGQFEIFVIPAAGGKPRRLTFDTAFEHVPSFSRDGKWIYFSSNRSGTYQVWKMPAAGGEAVQLTRDGGWVSCESPDGAFVYYTPAPALGGPSPLWRIPTSGGQPVRIVDSVLNNSFTLVERGIYYVESVPPGARIQFYDSASRRVTTVAPDVGTESDGFTASPDGRTVLFTRVDSAVDDLMLVEDFR